VAQARIVPAQTGHRFPLRKRIRPDRLIIEPPSHDLVVPDQGMNGPPGFPRSPLQIEHVVQHLTFVVAASNQIAHLHDRHRAADPLVARIDRAGCPEGRAQGADVGMDVADGDDASTAGLSAGRRPGDSQRDEQRSGEAAGDPHDRIVRQIGPANVGAYHVMVPPGGGQRPISRRSVMTWPRWWLLCRAARTRLEPRDSRAMLATCASAGSNASESDTGPTAIRFAVSIDRT
jgi:hypothetical protein